MQRRLAEDGVESCMMYVVCVCVCVLALGFLGGLWEGYGGFMGSGGSWGWGEWRVPWFALAMGVSKRSGLRGVRRLPKEA